ncbi:ligand-binding sensor domain-containing protein [Dyadobacter endophyticus]|uniref:ligand-binding sensor domain-containing protein n=1 Tax=Dyadobacter endophyticus TaxID=1749036 RepID=UPI003CF89A26
MKKLLIFLLALCAGSPNTLYGQVGYSVSQFTADNGLPQNSVKGISSDDDGFIWLATEDGLVRFDGHHFEVFNSSNLNISSNRVASIRSSVRTHKLKALDRPERVKVAYARFWPHYSVKIEAGHATADSNYYPNRDRRMLSLGLDINDLNDITYVVGLPDLLYSDSTGNDHHMIMAGGGEGNFFMITKNKIAYYQDWKKRYQRPSAGSQLWNYFSIGKKLYYRIGQGNYIQISQSKTSHFALAPAVEDPSKDHQQTKRQKFYWNGNSEQAFLFSGKNLYMLVQQGNGDLSAKLLVEDFDLHALGVDVIYLDNVSQKVFLGSRVNGLFVLSKTQFTPVVVKGEVGENVFYAQVPYSASSVITPTGIIIGKGPVPSQTNHKFVSQIAKINPFEKRIMLKSRNGTIWTKRYQTLLRIDQKSLRPDQVWTFENEITALCEGTDNDIWIGVINKGLYRGQTAADKIRPRLIKGHALTEITCLEPGGESEVLAGTSKGLYRVNTLTETSSLIEGTRGIHIKSIHPSDNGRVWITGLETGLMLLTADGKLTRFPLDRKRYLASSHCVVEDGLGYLWVTTNKGLFQVKKNDLLVYAQKYSGKSNITSYGTTRRYTGGLYYHYHAKDEGFNTNEFNGECQPCGVKLASGFISLPSLNGLIWFQPTEIRRHLPDERIILSAVEANGIPVSYSGETIDFPQNVEDVRLYFATAYLGHKDNLNVSYAVVKRSETVAPSDWIPLETDELTVNLTGHYSGEYSLFVRKNNGFGLDNYEIKHIGLNFSERWYENIWIILAISVAIIALVILATFAYNRHRLRSMRQKNTELEEVIAVRTDKLSRSLEDLEASRKDMDQQIYLLSRIVASISHDIQSPLRYVSFASKRIPDLAESGQIDEISKVGLMVSNMSDRMGSMLEQLVSFARAQLYGKKMTFETVNIYQLIQEKYELFRETVHTNASAFYNEIPENKHVDASYQLLSIIIHNLLDNATKYTLRGEIRVYLNNSQPDTKEIIIANTATNLPEEILELLTLEDNDAAIEKFSNSSQLKGLGLLIVKEVATLANIAVWVSQTDYIRFHLRLPRPGTLVKSQTETE